MPPIAAAMYRTDSELALELMIQAIATSDPAGYDDPARPEAIDEVTFDRNEPSLDENEDSEGDLNGRATPVVFGIDRIDEQRPAVLQVRHACHADDADDELHPRIPERGRARLGGGCLVRSRVHVILLNRVDREQSR